ncbi:hypothetical protein EK21DRAFT_110039 [Setomelanomma holmii]|uniref:Uncharacterized protein n=1 Tax=Setomelanomma holmii TaxID=210430 RepID=A0A9P4HEW0_9PLEO|nr:hypothetical protein EK21DRAFT_110039 [Setomelanomma holmii]
MALAALAADLQIGAGALRIALEEAFDLMQQCGNAALSLHIALARLGYRMPGAVLYAKLHAFRASFASVFAEEPACVLRPTTDTAESLSQPAYQMYTPAQLKQSARFYDYELLQHHDIDRMSPFAHFLPWTHQNSYGAAGSIGAQENQVDPQRFEYTEDGYWRFHSAGSMFTATPGVPYEATFMADAEDNVHSRDPLNQPPKSGRLSRVTARPRTPASAQSPSSHPAIPRTPGGRQSSLGNRSQMFSPGTFGSPRPSIGAGRDAASSPVASSPDRDETHTELVASLPDLVLPLAGIAAELIPGATPAKGPGRKRRYAKPDVRLEEGFAWDRGSLTLLGYWKFNGKKSMAIIIEHGDFPGNTEKDLDAAWTKYKDVVKDIWTEYDDLAKQLKT